MKTDTSPQFVIRLPLAPTKPQADILMRMFKQSKRLYNIVLKEGKTRVKFIKSNKTYRDLCAAKPEGYKDLLKAIQNNIPGMPTKSFATWLTAYKEFGDLKKRVAPSLPAQSANGVMERAWDVCSDFLYAGKKPHFRKRDEFPSIPGNQQIKIDTTNRVIKVNRNLHVKYWVSETDDLHSYALKCPHATIELVYDGDKFAAVWHLRGLPPKRVNPPNSVVGMDMGVTGVGVVSDTTAELIQLNPRPKNWGKIRRFQRRLARSQRASKLMGRRNHSEAKVKKLSARAQRREATSNKIATNILAKKIANQGDVVRCEDINYAAWMKRYGKAMQVTRPGALHARLRQLVEVETFNCRLALSQTCLCGERKKKTLSTRQHECPKCGLNIQRDVLSALLARHVVDGVLDLNAAKNDWYGRVNSLQGVIHTPSAVPVDLSDLAIGSNLSQPSGSLALVTPRNETAKLGSVTDGVMSGGRLGQALAQRRETPTISVTYINS